MDWLSKARRCVGPEQFTRRHFANGNLSLGPFAFEFAQGATQHMISGPAVIVLGPAGRALPFEFELTMRDDFTPATKRLLAARVGHVCSNPECRAPTSGPQLQNDKAVTAGDAAHITAASPGGARFDASLSSEQRRHHNKGIWLCVKDARLIDHDADRFPIDLLLRWKAEAESEANNALGRPRANRAMRPAAVAEFSRHARSTIAALHIHKDGSSLLGLEGHISQMGLAAASLGIPVPIEIRTLRYPNGVIADNPFLQDRFEGGCVIRFPDGSQESGTGAHASGLELLAEARDSAIVALEQWLIQLEHLPE